MIIKLHLKDKAIVQKFKEKNDLVSKVGEAIREELGVEDSVLRLQESKDELIELISKEVISRIGEVLLEDNYLIIQIL